METFLDENIDYFMKCLKQRWPKLTTLNLPKQCGYISPKIADLPSLKNITSNVNFLIARLVDTEIRAIRYNLDLSETSELELEKLSLEEKLPEMPKNTNIENVIGISITEEKEDKTKKSLKEIESQLLKCRQLEMLEIYLASMKEYENLLKVHYSK